MTFLCLCYYWTFVTEAGHTFRSSKTIEHTYAPISFFYSVWGLYALKWGRRGKRFDVFSPFIKIRIRIIRIRIRIRMISSEKNPQHITITHKKNVYIKSELYNNSHLQQ